MFETYGDLMVTTQKFEVYAKQPVTISFNHPLDNTSFDPDSVIEIDPPVKHKVTHNYNGLAITADTQRNQIIDVMVMR